MVINNKIVSNEISIDSEVTVFFKVMHAKNKNYFNINASDGCDISISGSKLTIIDKNKNEREVKIKNDIADSLGRVTSNFASIKSEFMKLIESSKKKSDTNEYVKILLYTGSSLSLKFSGNGFYLKVTDTCIKLSVDANDFEVKSKKGFFSGGIQCNKCSFLASQFELNDDLSIVSNKFSAEISGNKQKKFNISLDCNKRDITVSEKYSDNSIDKNLPVLKLDCNKISGVIE